MSKTLDPQAKALMEIIARAAAPAFHTLDVARAREETRKLHAYFSPDAPRVAAVCEVEIAGHGAAIAGRLYRPLGSTAGTQLPLLVFFHGGGWTVGDLDSYDPLCRTLANEARCSVLSVDYRLAPEHPFPAAVDDAYSATAWASEHAIELGVDGERIAVGGDSAGGNLAAVTAILARDRGTPALVFQLLVYPATDQSTERPSWQQFGRGYLLDLESIRYFQKRYLRHARDYEDWRASPVRCTDLTGLPPAFVITAGFDPLLDDCVAYVQHLRAAGVDVDYHCFDGMVHGFLTLGKMFAAAGEATRLAARALAQAFRN